MLNVGVNFILIYLFIFTVSVLLPFPLLLWFLSFSFASSHSLVLHLLFYFASSHSSFSRIFSHSPSLLFLLSFSPFYLSHFPSLPLILSLSHFTFHILLRFLSFSHAPILLSPFFIASFHPLILPVLSFPFSFSFPHHIIRSTIFHSLSPLPVLSPLIICKYIHEYISL